MIGDARFDSAAHLTQGKCMLASGPVVHFGPPSAAIRRSAEDKNQLSPGWCQQTQQTQAAQETTPNPTSINTSFNFSLNFIHLLQFSFNFNLTFIFDLRSIYSLNFSFNFIHVLQIVHISPSRFSMSHPPDSPYPTNSSSSSHIRPA